MKERMTTRREERQRIMDRDAVIINLCGDLTKFVENTLG